MTKFKEYYERMIATNKQIFDDFRTLHEKYKLNQDGLQEEFNKKGEAIMTIIKDWENKLCSQSEKAGFGSFTNGLSEKFWTEIRKEFNMIDYVGVIVKKQPSKNQPVVAFNIKKISL